MEGLIGKNNDRTYPGEPLMVNHQTYETIPSVEGEWTNSSEAADSGNGKAAAKLSIWDVVRLANPPGGGGARAARADEDGTVGAARAPAQQYYRVAAANKRGTSGKHRKGANNPIFSTDAKRRQTGITKNANLLSVGSPSRPTGREDRSNMEQLARSSQAADSGDDRSKRSDDSDDGSNSSNHDSNGTSGGSESEEDERDEPPEKTLRDLSEKKKLFTELEAKFVKKKEDDKKKKKTKRKARSRSTSPDERNPTRGTQRDQNAPKNPFGLAAVSMRMDREEDVAKEERVRAAAPRTAEVTLERTAVLDSDPRPGRIQPVQNDPTLPTGASLSSDRGVAAVIEASMGWSRLDGTENPLLAFLAAGKRSRGSGQRRERGWMRRREARLRGVPSLHGGKGRKHLSAAENTALVETKREVDRVRLAFGGAFPDGLTPVADLCHAYGVSGTKVKSCVQRFVRNDFSSARKRNRTAGETIFTSEKKREEMLTPLQYYKRWRRKGCGDALSDRALASEFTALDEGEVRRCRRGADALRRAIADVDAEIRRVLEETAGTMSWRRLAQLVAGGADQVQAVGSNGLRRHVLASEDLRRLTAGRVGVRGRPK